MDTLFSSERFRLRAQSAPYFREELLLSAADSPGVGLTGGAQFGVLSIEPAFPGPPEDQFAVRLASDERVEPGVVHANHNFLDAAGLRPEDERFWSVKHAPAVTPVREATMELTIERDNLSREVEKLRGARRELFNGRCLLAHPQLPVSRLSLPVTGWGYFNFRSIQPSPETLSDSTLLVFDESTILNLFVPHRRSGVDMVFLIDGSGSMQLPDYADANNRPRERLEGVKAALDTLLQRRLVSGSRVARLALAVFAANIRMLYPLNSFSMVEVRGEEQLDELRNSTRLLNNLGLQEWLKVDRDGTDISTGLRYAAELLDLYFQEGNEKVIVLLSDGGDWSDEGEGLGEGEIGLTTHDPVVLSGSLHHDSNVRIHTIAISSEQSLRRFISDRRYWDNRMFVPNSKLLQGIAAAADGLFFDSPDGRVLNRLFDEIGEGTLYPI